MLNIFYTYSKSRKYWIALICSAIGLISITLLIQYCLILKPCILCIYQRCALFGVIISGIIILFSPKKLLLRLIGISLWIYSSYKGVYFSKIHIKTILQPSPFSTCDLFIKFPNWIPLDKWCPFIFNAEITDCSLYTWYFLSIEISQWMFLIFTSYLIIATLTIISQFTMINK